MYRTPLKWAKEFAGVLTAGSGQAPRKQRRGRVILGLEELGERIVPSATPTIWKDTDGNHLWSDANNWSAGLPTASTIAVLNGTQTNDGVTFDNSVVPANQTVAGIQTVNGYSGTLSLVGGIPLTVSSLPSDATTGFQWTTGASISQTAGNNTLVITGGGTAANNFWNAGTIGSTNVQGNVYVNGGSTFQITGAATALGDNLIIGQDTNGSSVLEFKNQTSTLTLNNNAYIKISDAVGSEASANQLLFDTDVTQPGTASKGLDFSASSPDSFIDNYGTITRSNAGTYQINVPIKNDVGAYYTGTLDLQSSLWVSGQSANKTAGYSVDQVGGQTILDTTDTNPAKLQVSAGFYMNAGQLLTYGSGVATIAGSATVAGGTIIVSSNNHAAYGILDITANMSWSGGTLQIFVDGGAGTQQTQLEVGGTLSVPSPNTAELSVTANNPIVSGNTWVPIFGGSLSTNFTFLDGANYTLNTVGSPPWLITVRSN